MGLFLYLGKVVGFFKVVREKVKYGLSRETEKDQLRWERDCVYVVSVGDKTINSDI